MSAADADQRFVAVAVRAGLLSPDAARALLARAAHAGRPAWEVAVQSGALTQEQVAHAVRAAQPASWTAEDAANTLPAPPRAPGPPPPPRAAVDRPRLEVLAELGRGGMGRVLRARDVAIGREVAKKVLLDAGDVPPHARERFTNEARVTGQLEHPNIVPVHEVGTDPGGEPYFVMKLVRGRSLERILDATRADPAHPEGQLGPLLRRFLKVCEAVAYAHSRGVIHRDLKPANIMTGDFGEVLVMDWGLARVKGQADVAGAGATGSISISDPGARTQDGAILGTPAYMPPEQAEGDREAIDERSDVYALGAVLFELLALRPPFQGDSLANLIKRVLFDPPPRPSLVAPPGRAVPRELEAVALRALAKLPAERYPGAQELAAEVTRYLEGLPVEALPLGRVRRGLKWAARHAELTAAVIGATLLLLVLAGAGGLVLAAKERDRADASARASALAEENARKEEARAAAEARARAEADARLQAAARRAEAQPAFFRVAGFVEHAVEADQLRALVLPGLEEAVRIDPTFVEALVLLGEVRFRVGDAEGAKEALRRADDACRALAAEAGGLSGRRVPGSPAAHHILGQIARYEGKEGEARGHFLRAAELDPSDLHARLALIAVAERREERLEAAQRLFDELPFLPQVVSAYAAALTHVDDDEGARAMPRGDVEALERSLTEALESLSAERRMTATVFSLRARRGYVRKLLGRDADALADLRAADALSGRGQKVPVAAVPYLTFLMQLSHSLLASGEEEEGLRRLELAGRFSPTEWHVQVMRGQYRLSRGDAAAAEAELAAALRKLDASPGQGLEGAVVLCHIVAAGEANLLDEAARSARRLLTRQPLPFEPYFPLPDLEARLVRVLGAVRLRPQAADLARAIEEQLRGGVQHDEQQVAARLQANDAEGVRASATHGLACLDALGLTETARRLNLLGARSVGLFRLGRHADAASDLEACLRLNDRSDPTLVARAAADLFNLAVARANLGAKDAALDAFEQAAAAGFRQHELARRQPALAPLLADPRGQAALRRMAGD